MNPEDQKTERETTECQCENCQTTECQCENCAEECVEECPHFGERMQAAIKDMGKEAREHAWRAGGAAVELVGGVLTWEWENGDRASRSKTDGCTVMFSAANAFETLDHMLWLAREEAAPCIGCIRGCDISVHPRDTIIDVIKLWFRMHEAKGVLNKRKPND